MESNWENEVARAILENVVLPQIPSRKGKNSVRLSLKPTNATEGIIMSLEKELAGGETLPQYLCKMIMSYSALYEYRFSELLDEFRRNVAHSSEKKERRLKDDIVIDICGDDCREYARLIDRNESFLYSMLNGRNHGNNDLLKEK